MLTRGDRPIRAIAVAFATAAALGPAAAVARSPGAGTAPAGTHAARVSCRPGAGSYTIAQSATARVFTAANGNDYACLYSAGRAFYLSGAEHYEYERVHFAGAYVAFVQNVEASDESVGEMDLRNGRLRTFEIATPIENSVCYAVGSLALRADGGIAWIGTNFLGFACISPPGPEIEVRRHDRRGLRLLDSATTIAPGSLRLRTGVLSWTHGGVRRTATLY